MREIVLNKGQVVLVDDIDYETVIQHKWVAIKYKGQYHAGKWDAERAGYVYMQWFLTGAKYPKIVEHKDGNALNNTRGNLQEKTYSEVCRRRNALIHHGTHIHAEYVITNNKKLVLLKKHCITT